MACTAHLRGMELAATLAAGLVGGTAARAADAASAAAGANAGFPVSRSFKVTGAVQKPATYRIDDLKNEPITFETVYFGNASGATQASYKGVLLWTLLGEVGIKTDPRARTTSSAAPSVSLLPTATRSSSPPARSPPPSAASRR